MSALLGRMLRIRSLLENASRVALEQQVHRAAQAEMARQRAADAARQTRAAGLAPLLGTIQQAHAKTTARGSAARPETAEQARERYLAEAEVHAGHAARLGVARYAEQQARGMLACREDFLARRTERKQVEILIEEAAARRDLDTARREQRTLDDWYATSRSRRTRWPRTK